MSTQLKTCVVSLVGLLLLFYPNVSSAQSGTLTLNVIDESGKSVEISSIQLWVKTETGARGITFPTTTDSKGSFLVEGIPLGKYHKLTINKGGYAPFSFNDIEITSGRNREMTCTFSVGGTIEGVIVDDKEKPVRAIRVTVNSVGCRRDVVTDESGHFKAEHLADVRYSIIAEPGKDSPYRNTVYRGVAVCGMNDVRIVLKNKINESLLKPTFVKKPQSIDPDSPDISVLENASVIQMAKSKKTMHGISAPSLIIEQWYNINYWDLELKNKVVIVDFWGIWCSPCRAEIPFLQNLWNKYSSKGLCIVAVHTALRKEFIPDFLSKNNISYIVAVDHEDKTSENYKVFGYPTLYLIDKMGIIQAINPAKEELENLIVRLLNDND